MASLTKYAGTISQTTGGKYAQFSNLANLKNTVEGSWATTANIKGKSASPNRPSKLSFTGFSFGLPTGAEVSKVTVTYRHRKTGSCTIGAPTISLLGVSGFSSKGVAPSKTTMTTSTKTFTGSALTRTVVNSSSFGVKVDYPSNSGTGEGTISVSFVRITVEYKVPSYSLSIKKVSGGYNNEKYTIQCSISNKNLTSYSPTLTLTAPTGFSFSSASGSYTRVNARTITWNPKLSKSIGTATLDMEFDVDVTYPSGQSSYTGTFTLSESLYSSSKSLSATITDRPAGEGSESDGSSVPVIDDESKSNIVDWHRVKLNEEILIGLSTDDFPTYAMIFTFPVQGNDVALKGQDTPVYIGIGQGTWYSITTYSSSQYTGLQMPVYSFPTNFFKSDVVGSYVILFFEYTTSGNWDTYKNETPLVSYYFEVVPDEEDLSAPFFTILEPSEEEMNRLGSGYTYIAQSDINHTTTDTNVRDWYKNNRIGIHNNPLFIDEGVTGNKNSNWYIRSADASSLSVTVDDEGTTLSSNDTSTSRFYFANPENSTSTSPPITMSDFVIECDVISTTFTSGSQIAFLLQGLGTSFNLSGYTAPYHLKMVKEGTTVKQYVNDTEIRTTTISDRTNYYAGFQLYKTGDIKFKNYKIYSINLTFQEVFNTAKYWSKETGGLNTYENCEVEFVYDEDYPLYVLMTGDYPEATTYGYDMGSIKYDTPCIIEKQVYNSREASGNYPVPIEALLDNEEPSVITLAPNESTKGTVLYDLPLEDDFGTNEDYAIRGIQVRADIDSTDNLVIYAKIHNPNGEIGQRSIVLNGSEEEIVIGDLGDLWGFTTLQLTQLDDWELELSASNLLNSGDSEIVFNNVNITFYLETVEKQQIRVSIDGEDIAYYGAFIEKVDIPEGLETDTSFLTIDGTDTNDAYRQNIREKKITIEFNLNNCDLETSTNMLRQLTKLFTNEKDQYNRPIPKRLQFTHYPTDYFEYIMEEPFDVETDITDYTVKATLTIPSGTSYSLDDTVTNTVGNANGLAAINPTILFRPSDSNIQIKETISEQSFQMGYSGDWQNYTIELDCDDRRVYLIKDEDTKVDISKYVDHNSDWFRLSGEFEFEGINCTILTVTFNERW